MDSGKLIERTSIEQCTNKFVYIIVSINESTHMSFEFFFVLFLTFNFSVLSQMIGCLPCLQLYLLRTLDEVQSAWQIINLVSGLSSLTSMAGIERTSFLVKAY